MSDDGFINGRKPRQCASCRAWWNSRVPSDRTAKCPRCGKVS